MRLSDLKFHKAIYPRGLDKALFEGKPNEQQPDEENVERLGEAYRTGKLKHQITYNKPTLHILDGTHMYVMFLREHPLDWIIPEKFLNEVDIPENLEMFYAGVYNSKHGKPLSRNEVKAIIKSYMDESGKIKYGLQTRFSEEYNISLNTINTWVDELRHGVSRQHERNQEGVQEKDDLKAIIRGYEKEITTLKEKLEDITNKWENRTTICPKCGTKVG